MHDERFQSAARDGAAGDGSDAASPEQVAALEAQATERFARIGSLIDRMPESSWVPRTPWWLHLCNAILTAGAAAGLAWAWGQSGWLWWTLGVLGATVGVGFLINMLSPRSEAMRVLDEEFRSAIDDLEAEVRRLGDHWKPPGR